MLPELEVVLAWVRRSRGVVAVGGGVVGLVGHRSAQAGIGARSGVGVGEAGQHAGALGALDAGEAIRGVVVARWVTPLG